MSAEKRMREALPRYYDSSEMMKTAMRIMAAELERIEWEYTNIKKELSPTTAEKTLERWERDYGILPGESDTEERRRKILTAMRAGGAVTPDTVRMLAETYFDRPCTVIELYSKYTIIISALNGVPEKAITDFSRVARALIPAHLAFTVRMEYNTWGDVAQYTWGQLGNYTWDQVWKNKGGIA